MKNLLCSLVAKITAIMLSYVMVLVIVLSTAAAMVMGYLEFYTHSSRQMQKTILYEMAVGDGFWLSNLLQNSGLNALREEIGDMASESNIAYTVKLTETGETVYTNFDDTETLLTHKRQENGYEFIVHVYEEMPFDDEYSFVRSLIKTGHSLRYAVFVFAFFGLAVLIALICFLCCAAGRRFAYSSIQLNFLDKIPFDICLAFAGGVALSFLFFMKNMPYLEGIEAVIFLFVAGTVAYFILLALLLTSATRIKTHTFWKNMLIYKVLSFLFKWFKITAKFVFFHLMRLPLALSNSYILAMCFYNF